MSAIRGVAPHDVAGAVEAYLDDAGLAPARRTSEAPTPADVRISGRRRLDHGDLAGVLRAARPRRLPGCPASCTRSSARSTTTDDEGWSHTLLGCGTVLDRFHSYPAGLAWDDGDVAGLAASGRATSSSSPASSASTRAGSAGTSARPRPPPATIPAASGTATWPVVRAGDQGRRRPAVRRARRRPGVAAASQHAQQVLLEPPRSAGSVTNERRPGGGSKPTMSITSK